MYGATVELFANVPAIARARADYQQAADLYRQIGNTAKEQAVLDRLKALQP